MNGQAAGGCGFLRPEEIDRLLDRRLEDDRMREFLAHLDDGCMACALLEADLDEFRRVTEEEIAGTERASFEARSGMLGKRLRREIARKTGRSARPGSILHLLPVAAVLFLVAGGLVSLMRGPGVPGAIVPLPGNETWQVEVMPFHAPPTIRGESTTADLWRLAADAYADGEYRRVADLLARIEPGGAGEFDALLYLGICLHMTGEYEAALGSFDRALVLAEAEDLPVGAIAWFRSLTLLALDDPAQARETLETARVSGGAYSADAAALLDRLGP